MKTCVQKHDRKLSDYKNNAHLLTKTFGCFKIVIKVGENPVLYV